MPFEFFTAETEDGNVAIDLEPTNTDIVDEDGAVVDIDTDQVEINLTDLVSVDGVEDINAYLNEPAETVEEVSLIEDEEESLDAEDPDAVGDLIVDLSANVTDLDGTLVVQAIGY